MYLLVVRIGVWFWCTMCAESISMCYAAAGFLFALCVEYNVRTYRPVHVFDSISLGLQLESSQVVNVLVVGPVQLFPFPLFSGGCVFFSCWLRFVTVLCFHGLSPCVLICNLRT